MIGTVVGVVLGVVGGAAFARARGLERELELQAKASELEERIRDMEAPALPARVGALAPPPPSGYREPDLTAYIVLPEDAEDYAMLEEAVASCLESLLGMDDAVSEQQLRDCVLQSIYPDFTWPPVAGDPEQARILWLIVGHEARRAIAELVSQANAQPVYDPAFSGQEPTSDELDAAAPGAQGSGASEPATQSWSFTASTGRGGLFATETEEPPSGQVPQQQPGFSWSRPDQFDLAALPSSTPGGSPGGSGGGFGGAALGNPAKRRQRW
jgi:hypothetical protein